MERPSWDRSPYHDSDWNGSIAQPLPELWDNTNYDIKFAVSPGRPF